MKRTVLLIALVSLLFAACGDDDTDLGDQPGRQQEQCRGTECPVLVECPNCVGMELLHVRLPDGRVLECVTSDLGFRNGLLDCNWGNR